MPSHTAYSSKNKLGVEGGDKEVDMKSEQERNYYTKYFNVFSKVYTYNW